MGYRDENVTLEEIFQKHFGCKKPFLKNKKAIGWYSDGEADYTYLTSAGGRAYGKLTSLLEDIGKLLDRTEDVDEWIEDLDDIVNYDI